MIPVAPFSPVAMVHIQRGDNNDVVKTDLHFDIQVLW